MALVIALTCSLHAWIAQHNRLVLAEQRSEILEDQLEDYELQLIKVGQLKTYEDGLRDGFENSKNAAYVNGYHNALKDQNIFSPIISANK